MYHTAKLTHDTKILPDIFCVNIEGCRERIARRILTESTVPTGLRLHVPATLLREAAGVRLTVLTGWRREDGQFAVAAYDLLAAHKQSKERFEEVVERRQPVHPSLPESRQSGIWDDNSAERDDYKDISVCESEARMTK